MSTYYKETLSGQPIYRIASARVTFEKLDGTIGELDLEAAAGITAWDDVTGKPTEFPTSWALVTDKPDFVASGMTQAEARSEIAAAKSGANSDITSLTALSTPLSAAQGGTGVTTIALLANALNIEGFMPGLAPTISNLDTWTVGGLRSMTTTTTGRPTGTANGDMVMNFVSATNAAQLAFLMSTGNLVYRVFTTSWQPWQNVTKAALG